MNTRRKDNFSPTWLFRTWLWAPITQHLVIAMFLAGITLAVVGAWPLRYYFGGIERWSWLPDLVISLGQTVVGAGVFAFLLKTSQFSEHIKKILLAVLYSPESLTSRSDLMARWDSITNGILSTLLPASHSDAASMIKERYFDEELEYHFEDMNCTFRFEVHNQSTLLVDQFVSGHICPSPNHPAARLAQTIRVRGEGTAEIRELKIGTRDLIENGKVSAEFDRDGTSRRKVLTVPLSAPDPQIGRIKYYRHFCCEQDLLTEPYFQIELARFAKGYTVIVESPPDFRLLFDGDLESERDDVSVSTAADGRLFWTWELAPKGSLLLPGSSSTIWLLRTQGVAK